MTAPGIFPIDSWCLPIYEFNRQEEASYPVKFRGSGFVLPGGLFVTCKHCVHPGPDVGNFIGAVRQNGENNSLVPLAELSYDPSGADIATARVEIMDSPFGLAERITDIGRDVLTYGYPGTHFTRPDGIFGKIVFDQQSRYLEGYVTRAFFYSPPGSRAIPSWEVDMPTPAGVSGAPLILRGAASPTVIGVIYGRHLAHAEHDFTGAPGYVFGLAHHLDVLHEVRGAALGDESLGTHLRKLGRVIDVSPS